MNAPLNEEIREEATVDDAQPRPTAARPNYDFWTSIKEVNSSRLAVVLAFLAGLSTPALAVSLSVIGLVAIGVAFARAGGELTIHGIIGAGLVALMLLAIVLVSLLSEEKKRHGAHCQECPEQSAKSGNGRDCPKAARSAQGPNAGR